jgi:hypothetical protein
MMEMKRGRPSNQKNARGRSRSGFLVALFGVLLYVDLFFAPSACSSGGAEPAGNLDAGSSADAGSVLDAAAVAVDAATTPDAAASAPDAGDSGGGEAGDGAPGDAEAGSDAADAADATDAADAADVADAADARDAAFDCWTSLVGAHTGTNGCGIATSNLTVSNGTIQLSGFAGGPAAFTPSPSNPAQAVATGLTVMGQGNQTCTIACIPGPATSFSLMCQSPAPGTCTEFFNGP